MVARLQEKYQNEVIPALQQEFGHRNKLSVARIEKIVVSMGLGQAIKEEARLDAASKELGQITGQRPVTCPASYLRS